MIWAWFCLVVYHQNVRPHGDGILTVLSNRIEDVD
jgi:hypothetical protein